MSLNMPDQPAPRREAAQRLAWLLPIVIAGSASDLVAAAALARQSIDSGRAAAKLDALVKATDG